MPELSPPPTGSRSWFISFQRLVRLPNLLLLAACQALVYGFVIEPGRVSEDRAQGVWLLILSNAIIAAAGYIINDYYDIKIDRINKPDRIVVGRFITRRKAMIWHLVLTLTGIGLGLLLSWRVGAVNALAGGLLWLYSNQLKRMLLIGNVAIALLSGLAVLVVGLYFRQLNELVMAYAVFSFVVTLIREIIKDMEDLQGDARYDCYTLPIAIGIARTKYVLFGLLLVFLLLVAAVFRYLNFWQLVYAAVLVVAPTLYLCYRLALADRKRDFWLLSQVCKFIMLSGILSMLLLGY